MSEIIEALRSFPNESHVNDVCKPYCSKETCLFLVMRGSKPKCALGSISAPIINVWAINRNVVLSRNCDGPFSVVVKHQGELVGKRVEYEINFPKKETWQGVFEKTFVGNEIVSIASNWGDGPNRNRIISLTFANFCTQDNPPALIFSTLLLRDMPGVTTVFL